MAVIEGGTTTSLAEVGNAAALPMHITAKPLPVGGLGHYRVAATSGTIAAALAASAQLFYIRWTDATRYFVLHKFKASFQTLTPFTGGTLTDFGFDLHKATAVSAGGGGTDMSSAKTKMRATQGASLLDSTGLMRMATTAALTAITTLDAYPIAQSVGDGNLTNPAGGTEEPRVNDPTLLYVADMAAGEHPLVLAQNEGLALRNRTVWPVAGTGIIQIEMVWSEVSAF